MSCGVFTGGGDQYPPAAHVSESSTLPVAQLNSTTEFPAFGYTVRSMVIVTTSAVRVVSDGTGSDLLGS